MTPEMAQLMNGSLIPAVDTVLTNRMGNFWYIALFSLPTIMVYIRTQNIGLTSLTLFFSLIFYGYLFVGDIMAMSTIFAVILAIGVTVAIWKAFSPSN
jgi:hypothetical protein